MTRRFLLSIVCVVCLVSAFGMAAACGSPTSPSVPAGATRVTGTVQFLNLEGGFWAIRGDDGVTYDPKDGLPSAFRRDGMRISAVVKTRTDLGGIHMVGPIVELIEIKSL